MLLLMTSNDLNEIRSQVRKMSKRGHQRIVSAWLGRHHRRGRKMGSETTFKAVLVGCGSISRLWLDAVRTIPDLELVGFVDLIEESARRRATDYGWQRAVIGTDLRAVLEKTVPDAVFDCTVPEAHFHVTLEALRYGCHVLGEKPMADTMQHAREMVAAAQAAGKIYAVIQNRRYTPGIRRLRNFLASEPIGPITTVNSDFYVGPHFGGFRAHMEHVLLLDMAIHTFDAARFVTNADPVSVYCKEWNPVGSWYDHDASAIAIFEMTNGIVYTYRGSWCAEGLPTTWESDWRILGSRGSVKWDGEHILAQAVAETGRFLATYQDIDVPAYSSTKAAGHASLIREFVSCIRTGTTPETVCTDNIKSLAMVFGAIESVNRGKRVEISW
jgi:predicted dehydrogenase